MIITRTPLRITLGGGGTDLPSYYQRAGGMVISAAINKYVFVSVNKTFTPGYLLKYSELERVDDVAEIRHSIIREVLLRHDLGSALELVSVADIPAGTGLGSSGTFTVGLLRAVYAYLRHHVTAANLAEEACQIEIDVLGRPVGKQDQYIAAFGGLTRFDISYDGTVSAQPLRVTNATLHDLEEHLVMFFTGYARDADQVLTEQKVRTEASDADMLAHLDQVKAMGEDSRLALEDGDTVAFAQIMDKHWEHKKKRSNSMSNSAIDKWYDLGREAGALGGKLVGAGAGGFLLFYAPDPGLVRSAMEGQGLEELRFSFDLDGSTVVART